jgi:dGTP triphosphohydrolase
MKKQLEELLKSASKFHGITVPELLSSSRKAELVKCRRNISYYFYNKFTKCTTTLIGEILNRDHSSVVCLLRTIKRELKTYPDVKEHYEAFKKYMDKHIMEHPEVYDEVLKPKHFLELQQFMRDTIKQLSEVMQQKADILIEEARLKSNIAIIEKKLQEENH